jgi:glycosyltransferase involved in cell wall biosynthesis
MKLSIVIPACNEEANLHSLVADLLNLVPELKCTTEILIVNDNSTDNTGSTADSLARQHSCVRALHRNGSRGMGNTLALGTREAKGDYVIWVMADRSDDLETIPRMLAKIDEGYDVVFGSRYMAGGSSGDLEPVKALGSSSYTKLARLVFGIKVHDITNAFRAFRRSAFTCLRITSGDFAISPEFAIKAHTAGCRLGEVPTTYADRRAGKSSFKMMKMGIKYFGLMRYRFLDD